LLTDRLEVNVTQIGSDSGHVVIIDPSEVANTLEQQRHLANKYKYIVVASYNLVKEICDGIPATIYGHPVNQICDVSLSADTRNNNAPLRTMETQPGTASAPVTFLPENRYISYTREKEYFNQF